MNGRDLSGKIVKLPTAGKECRWLLTWLSSRRNLVDVQVIHPYYQATRAQAIPCWRPKGSLSALRGASLNGVLSRTGERICFPPEGRIYPQVPGRFETRLFMPLLHFTLKFHHQLLGPLDSCLHGLTVPYPMFAAVTCPVEGVIVKCHLAESKLHCTTHESVCRDTWLSGLAIIANVQVQTGDEQMVGGLLHIKSLKVLAEATAAAAALAAPERLGPGLLGTGSRWGDLYRLGGQALSLLG